MANKALTREEIESRIKEVISKTIGVDTEKISSGLKLKDDLGIDSFSAIEMIYNAEEAFGINIPDEELAKIATIADIIDLIEKKLVLSRK